MNTLVIISSVVQILFWCFAFYKIYRLKLEDKKLESKLKINKIPELKQPDQLAFQVTLEHQFKALGNPVTIQSLEAMLIATTQAISFAHNGNSAEDNRQIAYLTMYYNSVKKMIEIKQHRLDQVMGKLEVK